MTEKPLMIGLSTNRKPVTKELFENYKKAGIKAAELSLSADKHGNVDYKEIKKWADDSDVLLWSYHLPYGPFETMDLSSANADIRRASVEKQVELIGLGSEIGIDKFVVHASREPIEESDRERRMEYAKESLATLADAAASCGGVIAVEDLPRTCLGRTIADMKELLSADPRLRICFDTNHLLYEDPVDFARELGDMIITLHVSDYDKMNERHWLPGEGIIDFDALYETLIERGYRGPWMYEMRFDNPGTIIRERDLVCEDFVRNANEIFEHRPRTVISKPKPNLGMWG